ncbi:MAG: glycosyltransferase family 39 protein [Phycisphaerae bacterium]
MNHADSQDTFSQDTFSQDTVPDRADRPHSEMQGKDYAPTAATPAPPRHTVLLACALVLVFAGLATYLRFKSLGLRSLWHDEFATWHVSRMPLLESLYWQPELTKPPLYQFLLRMLSSDPKPSEWVLRFPAALCGTLLIPLVGWVCLRFRQLSCAAPAALLLACHGLLIEYSQEARPYTLLVLGSLAATLCWYEFTRRATMPWAIGYIATAWLTFYGHYLTILLFGCHTAWLGWLYLFGRSAVDGDADDLCRSDTSTSTARKLVPGVTVLVITAAGCVPMVWHYLANRQSTFQGLDWISPLSWLSIWQTLTSLGHGNIWVLFLVIPSLAIVIYFGTTFAGAGYASHKRITYDDPICLLFLWFLAAWGGLVILSLVGRPALVDRYALPAAVPLILIPLFVLSRVHRWLPMVAAVVIVLANAEIWINAATRYQPGIREMAGYLRSDARGQDEMVVLTIDNTTFPNWEDMERSIFAYYSLGDSPYEELHLDADGVTAKNEILRDPRGMLLVIGWADPFAILARAGRRTDPIIYEGESYAQLLFDPYRLVRVAPLDDY